MEYEYICREIVGGEPMGRKRIDLTGQKFGRLTVVKYVENDKWNKSRWLCQCDCGNQKNILSNSLKSNRTKSCGCLNKENITKHGHNRQNKTSKTYVTWYNMIQRCTNFNHKNYKDYGGRGIKVCEQWRSFENFLEDMGERPLNMFLDRVDNDGNYCKENTRWATLKEQNRNTRYNRLFTIDGEIKCLAEWCEIYQKPYQTVRWRINHGWSIEEALEIVPRQKR